MVLAGALLVACAAPPPAAQPAPPITPPAPAPTTLPTTPSPAVTPTPQAAQRTQTVTAQQTAQAEQGQLANVVADQNASAQQVAALQQTAAAAQHTVALQGEQLQGVAANQTAAARQLASVQLTAQAAQQGITGLQTAVANLVTRQQTAVAPKQSSAPTQIAGTPQPAAPKLLYAWFYKRPSEPPQLCGPGQGNPCVDSAPNQGTQYISGHVMDQHGMPVSGITVQAKNGSNPLFNTTDTTGYYSILLYTNCPSGPQSWDVYIVDGNNNLSSYVKTITYTNCVQAGEFHIDFVEAP